MCGGGSEAEMVCLGMHDTSTVCHAIGQDMIPARQPSLVISVLIPVVNGFELHVHDALACLHGSHYVCSRTQRMLIASMP